MGKLDGKVAIVTGAGNGMGQATAELFLAEGAKVVCVDVMKDSLEQYNGKENALAVYANLLSNEDIATVRNKAVEAFGTIDILCNIAGINDLCKTMEETSEAVWDKVVDLDLKAPYMLSKAVVEEMEKHHSGVILNIGSYAAVRGNHGPSYSAAKHGVVGLTMSMAVGLIKKGIRTNCINPGATNTNIAGHSGGEYSPEGMEMLMGIVGNFPTQTYLEPIEIAKAALFLCSDDAKYINGAILPVDNGQSCC